MCSLAWQSVWLTTVKWNKMLAQNARASASKIVQLIAREREESALTAPLTGKRSQDLSTGGAGYIDLWQMLWRQPKHNCPLFATAGACLFSRQPQRVNNCCCNCNWLSADHDTAAIKMPSGFSGLGALSEKSAADHKYAWFTPDLGDKWDIPHNALANLALDIAEISSWGVYYLSYIFHSAKANTLIDTFTPFPLISFGCTTNNWVN